MKGLTLGEGYDCLSVTEITHDVEVGVAISLMYCPPLQPLWTLKTCIEEENELRPMTGNMLR